LSSQEKSGSCAISTDVKKLWKAGPSASFCKLRDSTLAGKSKRAPVAPLTARPVQPANSPPLSDSAGLSPIEANGASEKCAKAPGVVHTACTVFPQALNLCNFAVLSRFERGFYQNFTAAETIWPASREKRLRKTPATAGFFSPAARTRRFPGGRCQ
jgi:hypothetical protein